MLTGDMFDTSDSTFIEAMYPTDDSGVVHTTSFSDYFGQIYMFVKDHVSSQTLVEYEWLPGFSEMYSGLDGEGSLEQLTYLTFEDHTSVVLTPTHDWRTYMEDAVPAVRDSIRNDDGDIEWYEECGSSWSFAGAAAIDAHWYINVEETKVSVSAQ